ncbi:hypothetical protein MIMGU_mgv1a019562mg [Erythranthe guttata]|uniref:Aluminum-activated malate transporter n=1 Tax=Erythranthe guttata TaxID=4155 RepID=A0A022QJS9_ERYGU|nr:PREDICTED: aluminum-activated malate transporter 8-like [Erythranthe guttata]EYU28937.1 hypothetical protein MIMGU_mgv1a019562mg [Erythranthe guttata]|eukprot:XP_012847503.1 PREDICTED: aluminum-activated malate transporter 8-like [Erythranthe guttata]
MEMNNTIEYSEKQEKIGSAICERVNNFFKGSYEKFDKSKVTEIAKIEDEDRRRIIHSVKVGLAITLVSFLYYLRPLYDGLFGQAGMSAVLTVVVVFEFSSVGALFSKCLNSGAATLVAGGLGVGAGYLARLCGDKGEAIVLGILVFLLAAASTYMRFIPSIKSKYDHGVVIFILTFTLVAILGYRVTEISILGHQRLSTIFMGGAICILVSVSVCPVWAGQDLHLLVSGNIDKLATFFLGYGDELSTDKIDKYLEDHKTVLDSKVNEESLANFAWWEPPHGEFRYNHPWEHYLELGVLTRECANHIQTLISTGYCINSKPQELESEFDLKIEPECKKLSTELGKALKELASATKGMTVPQLSAAQIHISNSKSAADELIIVLQNCSSLLLGPTKIDLGRIMPPLVTTSILVDVIECIERISASVDELSQKARFRKLDSSKDQKKLDDLHVVIDIKDELDAKQETL